MSEQKNSNTVKPAIQRLQAEGTTLKRAKKSERPSSMNIETSSQVHQTENIKQGK
jgi:hypothetical protein